MSAMDATTGEVVDLPWPTHPAADLFPMLSGDDLDALVADIKANGLIEPVWLYDDPEHGTVLLDGRNRARACQSAGVEVRTQHYRGDDPITFSVAMNATRRHLTAGQRAALACELEPLYAAEAAKRMLSGKAQEPVPEPNPGADLPQGAPKPKKRAPRARDRAAKQAKASGRATAQFKRLKEQAPDLAAKVRSGEMALDRAERVLRDRAAEADRIAQAKRDAEQAEVSTTVDIREGDFRDVLADLRDVDAIITDPPYPFEFLPLLDDLAAWADKVLADDGVLAVLIGQTHLPEVYRRLDGHRPYRWTAAYLTEGPGYVSHPRKVQSSWKPVLIYGGGPRIGDIVRSSGDDKRFHKWGQNYDAFRTIVERLTVTGQTVVDPFMGAGTTLLAAHALGRNAIGCDIDPESVAATRERLS